jgi:hypothetical protein
MSENWKRIVRPATAEERTRHSDIREQVVQEFPPLEPPRLQPVTNSIGAQIRQARQAQGLTRLALAEWAGRTVVRHSLTYFLVLFAGGNAAAQLPTRNASLLSQRRKGGEQTGTLRSLFTTATSAPLREIV